MREKRIVDRVLESVNQESVVFDDYIHNDKKTYKISDKMRDVIWSSFPLYCEESQGRYSDLFEKHDYAKYGDTEEYVDGPVKFYSYDKPNYPSGYVHKIDAYGVTYLMGKDINEVIVRGSYNIFYTEYGDYYFNTKYDTRHRDITDTLGIMNYVVRINEYGVDDYLVEFRMIDKDRQTGRILSDKGYLRFLVKSTQELFDLKEKLSDFDYAKSLFNEDKETVRGTR